ncbi:hypothetical protein F8388_025180 [Cannabis sativa]|uniref:Uncharacterized protein n=1 Tax=Cannabis sativa TaxID=3483 RepID=A0A7J6FRZ0_CANSA|nr:hypothetical protein F8388_025180 [Cannabis sativa]
MAGRQISGDGLPSNLAGMTKSQLYDIMSQMKTLIEQNQQQARQILIQNPLLTKALFQAQIMLGMVQPPQAIPKIEQPPPQHSQQPTQISQQSNIQASQSLSVQVGPKDQAGSSQMQTPARMQPQNQPPVAISTPALPSVHIQPPQPTPIHPMQTPQPPKVHSHPQATPSSLPLPNLPSHPHHSSSQQPPLHQSQMSTPSGPLQQQSMQAGGISHLPLQPPLPPQPRPHSMGNFQHQYPPHMGGYQHGGPPPQHHSQPMFHSGNKPPGNVGPSFSHPQHPHQSQPPPQSMYQGGNMPMGAEFNNQGGNPMQMDRGSAWMPAPPENSASTQLSAHQPVVHGQMGPGNQPPRAPSLTPEMEKALLQQVMSLTPEQINLLPPDQRNQVLQLQQILRQ